MASLLSCGCPCGYRADAWVAASRAGHGKHFRWPCLCSGCAQVVSVDMYADPDQCPECGSNQIAPYGLLIPDAPQKVAARLMGLLTRTRRRYRRQLASLYDARVAMAYAEKLQTTYGLLRKFEPCPRCKSHQLKFELEALVD